MADEILDEEYLEAMRLAEDIEREFIGQPGPILYLLDRAREAAIQAMERLTWADPADPVKILTLQNDVKRYRDMVQWIREALAAGDEAWKTKRADPRWLARLRDEDPDIHLENDA